MLANVVVELNTDGNSESYKYKCDMVSMGSVYFQPDTETLHWAGVYYRDSSLTNGEIVAVTYNY